MDVLNLLPLVTNLAGGGIGPQAVGIMSDYLAAGHQQDSLFSMTM